MKINFPINPTIGQIFPPLHESGISGNRWIYNPDGWNLYIPFTRSGKKQEVQYSVTPPTDEFVKLWIKIPEYDSYEKIVVGDIVHWFKSGGLIVGETPKFYWEEWFVFIESNNLPDPFTINGVNYTHAELVGQDYPDIIVKYDNQPPHTIREIGLLKPELVGNLTQDQLNKIHELFDLWVYWSGEWNNYGVMKENRQLDADTI